MLRQSLGGFVVGFILLRALVACGSTQLVECQLHALKSLPDDPGQITPYDTLGLVQSLKACRAKGDAGP
jgi:hypothetical protein